MFEPKIETTRLPTGATLLCDGKLCTRGASKLSKFEKDNTRDPMVRVTLSRGGSPAPNARASEDSEIQEVYSAAVAQNLAAPLGDEVASTDPCICIGRAVCFGRLPGVAPER